MASTATPYGLIPINLIGGQSFAGSTRMLPIANGLATNIFFGDVVKCVNTGVIDKDTGTATLTPIGVFMGCNYTDATYGFTARQMWTASTVATDAVGVICDDPDTLFRIQANAAMTQTMLFNNAGVVQGSGVAASGNSAVSLDVSTVATTDSLPLRIVGWVNGVSSLAADSFPDVIVKWNFGMHAYNRALGV